MTTTQRTDAVELARALAAEFAPRAAELDRSGDFPFENYARMRELGYLRTPVPTELGGLGAGLLEMSKAQQALARGCASTALAVNMHLFQVGLTADGWRNGAPVEPFLRRVADEGIVVASNGAEALVVGEWTTPTTAVPEDGHYVLSGRKYFCSQAPGMDVVRLFARDTATDELLIVSVPKDAQGLTIEETWDTMGMRATASHDIVLEEVRVADAAVGARVPAGAPLDVPPMPAVGCWFLSLVAGVYLGVAEEAREQAFIAMGRGINSSHRDQALTDVLIGEMEAEFFTALAVRDQLVGRLDADRSDIQRALALATLCKEIVLGRAEAVVDRAVQIAGGRAYFRRSPLERLARDVRAGRFHPPSSPVSMQIVGQRARASTGLALA